MHIGFWNKPNLLKFLQCYAGCALGCLYKEMVLASLKSFLIVRAKCGLIVIRICSTATAVQCMWTADQCKQHLHAKIVLRAKAWMEDWPDGNNPQKMALRSCVALSISETSETHESLQSSEADGITGSTGKSEYYV